MGLPKLHRYVSACLDSERLVSDRFKALSDWQSVPLRSVSAVPYSLQSRVPSKHREGEKKNMSNPQSSFYSFLMEPIVDLEPGIAEERDMLASFNIQLEQNMRQIPGKWFSQCLTLSCGERTFAPAAFIPKLMICRSFFFFTPSHYLYLSLSPWIFEKKI